MRIALFSDIHSNLQALEAVLADIKDQSVDRLVCLGDIVGYAANPSECLQLVTESGATVVLGNHDQECCREGGLQGYNRLALAGLEYSRTELSSAQKDQLSKTPYHKDEDGYTLVHASLFLPHRFPYVIELMDAAISLERQQQSLCFIGHTHVPKVWHAGEELAELTAKDEVHLPSMGNFLVNVGSVGQPRDRDARACYVIYDAEKAHVTFRRLEYNLEAAQSAIVDAGLPEFLARRLELGR